MLRRRAAYFSFAFVDAAPMGLHCCRLMFCPPQEAHLEGQLDDAKQDIQDLLAERSQRSHELRQQVGTGCACSLWAEGAGQAGSRGWTCAVCACRGACVCHYSASNLQSACIPFHPPPPASAQVERVSAQLQQALGSVAAGEEQRGRLSGLVMQLEQRVGALSSDKQESDARIAVLQQELVALQDKHVAEKRRLSQDTEGCAHIGAQAGRGLHALGGPLSQLRVGLGAALPPCTALHASHAFPLPCPLSPSPSTQQQAVRAGSQEGACAGRGAGLAQRGAPLPGEPATRSDAQGTRWHGWCGASAVAATAGPDMPPMLLLLLRLYHYHD